MKAILLSNRSEKRVRSVYTEKSICAIRALCDLEDRVYNKEMILAEKDAFGEVRYLFSTWGMPVFEEEEIREIFPNLEAVFYAAGSVQKFARPFLNLGIHVFSAWAANGIPVAEYTFAQITLASKGFYQASRVIRKEGFAAANALCSHYTGNYDAVIGLVGAGMIGKMVIEKLKALSVEILVFDPFLPDETAKKMGVKKVSLEELFSRSHIISNHLANNDETKGMLTGALFSSMPPFSTFINTGRGAQVKEEEMISVLKERPDLTAILDVTFPEPAAEGSPLYSLENVVLTPHIAGSEGNEVRRMAEYMLKEAEAFLAGNPTKYEVTLEMLKTMA